MSSKIKKAYLFLFILIAFFLTLYFAIKHHDKRTLKVGIFYGSNWEVPGTEHYDVIDHAIALFNEKYPDIKVEYETGVPYSSYSEWIYSQILKGNEPDVYLVLSDDFENLVSLGALYDVSDMVEADPNVDSNLMYESAYKAGTIGQAQYALPFECNPTLMFVNKSILDQEGIAIPESDWTWDDFYDICSRVLKDKDGDGTYDQFGYYDYNWKQAVYSNGEMLFSQDGTQFNATEEAFIEAIQFIDKISETQKDHVVEAEDFDLGKVVFHPLTFSDYRTYMPYPWRIKKYSNFEWTCIPMPAGPSGENISSMDVLMAGISSRTEQLQEAWYFLKLLTFNEDIQKLIYSDTSGSSALKSVVTSRQTLDFLKDDTPGDSEIDMSLMADTIEKAVVPVKFRNYADILSRANALIDNYLDSDDDITMSMLNIKNEIEEELNDQN